MPNPAHRGQPGQVIRGGLGHDPSSSGNLAPTLQVNFLNAVVPAAFTYARASTASYYNSSGILTQALSNTPRFDYNPSTLALNGLLIEEQRTNLLVNSQMNGWTATGGPVVTNNNPGAPDGSSTFAHFTRTTTAASYVSQATSKAASSLAYSYSVYAKQGSVGNFFALRVQGLFPAHTNAIFNLSTATVTVANSGTGFAGSASIQALPNGIYRCTLMTSTTDTSTGLSVFASFNSAGVQIDGTDSASNSDGYMWGAQLEQAPFSTSYIPTTATTVTRAADSLSMPLTPNASAGSFYMETILSQNQNAPSTFSFSQSNNGLNTLSALHGQWWNGTSNVSTGNSTALGSIRKEGFAYTASSRAICLNGGTVATDSNVPFSAPQTTAFFGATTGGTQNINAWLCKFSYWNTTLTNANLKQVTT